MTATPDLAADHHRLDDTRITRRYFAKFARMTGHLGRVAAVLQSEGRLSGHEVEALGRLIVGLNLTFRALAHKYHFAGRYAHAGRLTFDRIDSGFPVAQELMQMAADAAQADRHLADMPTTEALKDQMVRAILSDLAVPLKLQFALSQRLYYEELRRGALFWPRNDPTCVWTGDATGPDGRLRRRYLVSWAVYDTVQNLPVAYLMDCEDSGRTGLPKDETRWPEVQAHLMAQAVAGLKLLTIATGFDQDFDDLHPVRLRRFHIGPMHSHAFTLQEGPIREVLARAMAPEGEDWALVWTEEDLVAERTEQVKSGWFGTVERQIYQRDPTALDGGDAGYSRLSRSILMPERPYQALAELDPPGFRDVRKFVVGPKGTLLNIR